MAQVPWLAVVELPLDESDPVLVLAPELPGVVVPTLVDVTSSVVLVSEVEVLDEEVVVAGSVVLEVLPLEESELEPSVPEAVDSSAGQPNIETEASNTIVSNERMQTEYFQRRPVSAPSGRATRTTLMSQSASQASCQRRACSACHWDPWFGVENCKVAQESDCEGALAWLEGDA